jgi:hypothetical protein
MDDDDMQKKFTELDYLDYPKYIDSKYTENPKNGLDINKIIVISTVTSTDNGTTLTIAINETEFLHVNDDVQTMEINNINIESNELAD